MDTLRLAIATQCFRQPLRKAVRSASAAGARGVLIDVRNELRPAELSDTGRRQFQLLLGEMELRVAAVTFPLRRRLYDQRELEGRIDALRRSMEFAFQLQSGLLLCRIGKIPLEADSAERRILVDVLNDLARFGNRIGTVLGVTPVEDDPSVLASLLDSVTEGPVAVDFDPAAFVFGGHDPAAALRTLHPRVQHVRLRDGIRDVDGSGLEVEVGRGEVDWPELIATLAEADYRGWLTAVRTAGDDPGGDATRALEYVRNVAPL